MTPPSFSRNSSALKIMGSPLMLALVATIGRSKYSKSSRCTPVLARKMPILLRFGATLGAIKIAPALKIAEKLAGKRTKSTSLSEWALRTSVVHTCAEHEPCKFIVCCGLGSLATHCEFLLSAASCKFGSLIVCRCSSSPATCSKLEFASMLCRFAFAAYRKPCIFAEFCEIDSSVASQESDLFAANCESWLSAADCKFNSLAICRSSSSPSACGRLKFLAAHCKPDLFDARPSSFSALRESPAIDASQAKLRRAGLLKICALCNPPCSAQTPTFCMLKFCAAQLRKFCSTKPCPCAESSCSLVNFGDIVFSPFALEVCVPKSAAKPASVRQTNSRFFKITIGLTLQSISASSSALRLAVRHACAASRHMIAKGLLGRFLSIRSMRTARSFVASQTM